MNIAVTYPKPVNKKKQFKTFPAVLHRPGRHHEGVRQLDRHQPRQEEDQAGKVVMHLRQAWMRKLEPDVPRLLT